MALDKFRKSGHRPDYAFIGLILILLCIGLLMILSSSVVVAFQNYGNNYYFVTKQLTNIVYAMVVFFIAMAIDYHSYKKIAVPFFVISVILAIAVLIPGIGVSVNGAQRWLDFGFVRFQASEVLKLGLIIYFSFWLSVKIKELNTPKTFITFLTILASLVLIVILQRDLGTTIIITSILILLYFLAGGGLQYIALTLGLGFFALIGFIRFEAYRLTRFLVFLNPDQQLLGAGYHINQALLAIGTGGLWGLGFSNSKQKYLYLPEPHTDSIFAIMGEELGFIRILIFLLILTLFLLKGFAIAKSAPDNFGRFLGFGIMSWFAVQSILNISAMLGLVPLTGVPLPLISYGGTSVVILLAALGIVVNISKYSIRKEKEKHARA